MAVGGIATAATAEPHRRSAAHLGDPMTDQPRLAPVDPSQVDAETAQMLESLGGLNIFATLAHHPKLMKRWLVFGNHILNRNSLDERRRELVILRTGWRCASDYEFGQHTVIGKRSGLTEDEIRQLASDDLNGWSAGDATVVMATDELVREHTISDSTWAALTDILSTTEIMDLIFTVGQYVLVSSALNALGVQREEGVPGWPT
jgi:4-carboxymuconolactone decarboxylase